MKMIKLDPKMGQKLISDHVTLPTIRIIKHNSKIRLILHIFYARILKYEEGFQKSNEGLMAPESQCWHLNLEKCNKKIVGNNENKLFCLAKSFTFHYPN